MGTEDRHEYPDETPQDAADRHLEAIIGFVKDNLEAIAVAVVMALVIKHFCVEAFKIPTESMFPTLHGERTGSRGKGDRILVDKFAYLIDDPQRFDVIVFRYPLNRARNFIKRIGGIGGERMHISDDGDLWVRPSREDGNEEDLRIPQKPRRVREQLYMPVYPPPVAPGNERLGVDAASIEQSKLRRGWRTEIGAPNAWRLESYGQYSFAGGPAASLRSARTIRDRSRPDNWASASSAGELVRDVRFRFTLRLEETEPGFGGPSRFTLRWAPDGEFLAVLTLSTERGRSEAFVRRGTETLSQAGLDVVLSPGEPREIEMEYVDGRLRVHLAGDQVAVLEDGRRYSDTYSESGEQRTILEAEGGALHLENLRIDRDLRYSNSSMADSSARRGGIDIPESHYFMLGDNVANSSDSRVWRLTTVHLKGGRTIRHDTSPGPDEVEGEPKELTWRRVVDADGVTRTWALESEDHESTTYAPFVHRDLIVGRAFLVFWPFWPDFPGRIGFIH